jgi:amino acid transporter
MGPKQAQNLGYISYLVLFIGVIWSCINYGNQMNNSVTFGNVFAHGFKTSAVVTVISIIFTVIFFLIFPEIKDKVFEVAREEMDKQPQLTDDQRDMVIETTKKFFFPIAIGSILLMYLIIGLIASLIGAAMTKKNPPSPFENQVR